MRLLLLCLPLLWLAQCAQDAPKSKINNRTTTLSNTECNVCKNSNYEPPISKCTDCEAPIRAKGQIAERCSGTLTCGPGRILIANNRYVVTDVRCSEDSSKGEELWIGKTSDNEQIHVESAACFITPISCISLGSFSMRCPRGYNCDPVIVLENSLICPESGWRNWVFFNLHHKHLWYRKGDHSWDQLHGPLACDPQLGTWVETVPVKSGDKLRAIVTDRIICGKPEFDGLGLTIELQLGRLAVLAMQICLPILVIALICILKQWLRRKKLKGMKAFLDQQRAEGKKKLQAIKDSDKQKVRGLIDRWRQVNTFVVDKNKPTVIAYKRQQKNK